MKPYSLITLTFLILLSSCKENESKKYGNDGANLEKIDLSNAVALFSVKRYDKIIENGEDIYQLEELYRITNDGSPEKSFFTITGNTNGGFDRYTVNDINGDYFLISFYLREESYFVNKKTGLAIKSSFIKTGDLNFLPYDIGFASFDEKLIYFRDLDNKNYFITDYLNPDIKVINEFSVSNYIEIPFIDKNENLYYLDQFKIYSYINNIESKITPDNYLLIGAWSDIEGNITTVDSSGKVYIISNGEMTMIGNLKTKPYPGNHLFTAINFKTYGKTFGLMYDASGNYYIYDLITLTPIIQIKDEDLNGLALGTDSNGKYFNILFQSNDKKVVIHADVTNNSYTRIETVSSGDNSSNSFFSISNDMYIIKVCETLNGACYVNYKLLNANGVLTNLFPTKASGKVIKLNE